MKTIEIDGKKYIEYKEHRYQTLKAIKSFIFLILLTAAIIGLLSGVAVILKNKEMLTNEPLTYVMGRYNLVACGCIDQEGQEWYSGKKGFLPHYENSDYDSQNIILEVFNNRTN